MQKHKLITVAILYGHNAIDIFEQEVRVEEGSTIKYALDKSNLKIFYPNLDWNKLSYAVYSKPVTLDYQLQVNDRIEVLRELIADPKELRLIKAARQEALKKVSLLSITVDKQAK